jgi:chromate transporter
MSEARVPTFRQAFVVWMKIGWLSFGGPAGQIALMHQMLVDERRWVNDRRFLHALNYCMLLPGPEAQQLATYIGWLLHGLKGGLVAGTLFVLPGALVIFGLSIIYAWFGDQPLLAAVFVGIKATVLVVVVQAVFRIGKKVLTNATMVTVAAAAFVGIFLLDLPFPLIVLGAGVIGFVGARVDPKRFVVMQADDSQDGEAEEPDQMPGWPRALKILLVGLVLWFSPIALAAVLLGDDPVFVDVGLFFSKLAVVSFGGAYAVLSYMGQQAVEAFHWLTPGEMIDGLGLAESTPGPLIMVVQFVGFLATYRHSVTLEPMTAAALGSALTVWVTFVPCFVWIFVSAPYVERMQGNKHLSAALSAITAAVVGVILNLAIWFGLHVLFATVNTHEIARLRLLVPDPASLDPVGLALVGVAAVLILGRKIGVLPTLGLTAVLGAVASFV